MTIEERYSGIQDIADTFHHNACHFICLLSIAEEELRDSGQQNAMIDLIDAIKISQSKGWFSPEFYGKETQLKLLEHYTGKHWTRRKETKLPFVIKPYEYTEVNYYNPKTKLEHFRRRRFDPKFESITVRDGYIRYYYIYTCEDDKSVTP